MSESTVLSECSFDTIRRCPRMFRDPETLGEPAMSPHDGDLSRIRIIVVGDPRRDIPRHRRFVVGADAPDMPHFVEDRWELEPRIPCVSSPEAVRVRDRLNRPDNALEAIGGDAETIALLRQAIGVGA